MTATFRPIETRPGSGGLAFAPRFRVETVDGEAVFLLSERGHVVLRGDAYLRLAPLLDGRREIAALVDALDGVVPAAEVYFAINRMRQQGYVVEADVAGDRAGWWNDLGLDAGEAERRLRESSVAVVGFGGVSVEAIEARLSSAGVAVAVDNDEREASLVVAVTDDYLRGGLAELNAAALGSGQQWLLVRPGGRQCWLGPLIRPGQSACWACLAQRLRANRDVERFVGRRRGTGEPFPPPASVVPSVTTDAVVALIVLEVLKALGGATVTTDGRVVTLEWPTLERAEHLVVHRPQCAACGDPSASEAQPVEVESQPKGRFVDGGYRADSPHGTWTAYRHHISPVSGAVSGVHELSPASRLFVYTAGPNMAMPADSVGRLRGGLRSRSAGKGRSREQARCSALCEALERYSGRLDGTESRRRASYEQLGELAIHPNACMLWSDAQYDHADRWNEVHPAPHNRAPARFDEHAVVDWTPLWSLTTESFRYLPTRYCFYASNEDATEPYYRADSNGNAAGTTRTEAILQGFFELAERDAAAMWWYHRLQRPGVDLDTIGDPYVADLRAQYDELHRDVAVLDITNDLGIPTFVAVSWRTDGEPERVALGFGAHFDARVGTLRALTELNQIVAFTAGSDDLPSTDEADGDVRELVDWLRTATRENQPYLAPAAVPSRRIADYPQQANDDLADDVRHCQAIVEAKGLELLVLDQTRPDIGLPVVKVVVPGLRHFWARFAPGRLFDVPVELGWVPGRVAERELNPIAMFL